MGDGLERKCCWLKQKISTYCTSVAGIEIYMVKIQGERVDGC